MKIRVLLCAVVLGLSVAACTGDSAKELYETAQFEELQNNREHAEKLYRRILKDHPDSSYAREAEKRLLHLEENSGDSATRHP